MQKKIYILTTDRYWPWNGKNITMSDRIWNNLDKKLELQFLILVSSDRYKIVEEYKNHVVLESNFSTRRFYLFFAILFKVLAKYIRHRNRRLLLGLFKPYLFFYKPRFKWLWSYALLRSFFQKNKVDALIYHGEFNDWGLSVIWACRDAKVKCFAYQHGVIFPGFKQYSITDEEYKILPMPDHLFLFSKQAEEIANKLTTKKIPRTIVGSSRFISNYCQLKKKQNFQILILPTTTDYKEYVEYLKKNIVKFSKDKRLIFKPHPLRELPQIIKKQYNIGQNCSQ